MNKEMYSLTNPQKSILLTEEFYKGSNINNICGTAIIDNVIDFDLLKKAMKVFVKNHDSFNLKLTIDNNEIKQYLDDVADIDIEIVDIDSKDDISKIENTMLNHVFDIYNGDLFCMKIFRLKDNTGGFIVNVHHLFGDSWSLGIVANDIVRIYSCLLNGEEVVKNDDFSYLNYIDSEKQYLTSDKFKKDKEYWENIFDTVPELATIPGSIQETNNDFSCKANRKLYNIDNNLMDSITDYCKLNHVSVFNFFMAVYAIYISRVSRIDDFVLGTPILNRTNFNEKNTTGMFINTAPLRFCIDNSLDFKSFVSNIAKDSLGMLRHQKYYYQNILEDLRKKDASIPNLYNILLSYQVTKAATEKGLNYSTRWNFNGTSADDIDIHLFDLNDTGSINVAYDYKVAKYTDTDIEDMHNRILHIIWQILERENICLKDIEIVTSKEKYDILYKFNGNCVDFPDDINLVSIFNDIVKKCQDNTAVLYNNSTISYKELDKLSDCLAILLLKNGVKPQDVIGVCMNRSIELIISIWAILKIGAIYMPMYVKYPTDRLLYMIQNSNCKLIITNSVINESLTININKLILNHYSSLLKELKDFDMTQHYISKVDDLAYIIYTSGSTGKPKGVQITHKNLINFIYAFNRTFKEINEHDNFLASTNISFDVSIFELFLPILNGSKLVLYNEDYITDIINYSNTIIDNQITMLYIPPNILDDVYSILKDSCVKIDKLLVGVEGIKKSTLNKYFNINNEMIIVNGYGPTETTICATTLVYKKDYSDDNYVSIGKPLCNNNIYILNTSNTLQPVGVPGELCISGFGVGKGYINNPKQTSSSFIPNCFDNSSKYMYKTGDIAKWNSDGTITFVGRKDNQIKLHGYRIELSEISNIIEQTPYITKALATIKEINRQKYLVTYFSSTEKINSSTLDVYLKSKLPFYMIPNYYMQLENFPLTVNGKIDTKNLPLPNLQTNEYVKPSTETELILSSIWSQLFNKEKISITDNFFTLGGDSLTAIKFQIEALKYDININYSDIFNYPTIKLLSEKKVKFTFYKDDLDYDYTEINKIISTNTISNLSDKSKTSNFSGNLLLLGATGFLGAHILDAFLCNTNNTVYCLVRDKGNLDKEQRLKKTLNFYFGEKYNSYFGNRIQIVSGDISFDHLGLSDINYELLGKSIDIVVNSAAFVKHYGDFKLFDSINVLGTKHIINFCKQFNKKLYHISTISVSGVTDSESKVSERKIFNETHLYIGQNLNNAYIYTKFEAEKTILEEVLNGLDACILRIGNISNRVSDAKFQINTSDNAYINRMKSLFKLGVIPEKFLEHSLEFTPVDACSNAIVKIIMDNTKFNILHLFNTNLISFPVLISILSNLGYPLQSVSDKIFAKKVDEFLKNDELKNSISGIIPDLDNRKSLNLISNILPSATFTTAYLKTLGFEWPNINLEYITKYIEYFKSTGYLE